MKENLHIRFSESTPNVVGTQSNNHTGTKASDNAGQARKETKSVKDYILLSLWTSDLPFSQDPKSSHDDGSKPSSDDGKKLHKQESCQRIWRNMGLLVLFNKEQTIKTFKTACLLAFYHRKNPKRNKKDEREIMKRDKARLVAQGYTQEKWIDYDEIFVLVARIKAIRTRIVKENLHIRFSESTPNVVGSGPDCLFDIDALTKTMNYEPIVTGTQSNNHAGTKASDNAGQARKETKSVKYYILLSLWTSDLPFSQDPKSSHDDGSKPSSDDGKKFWSTAMAKTINGEVQLHAKVDGKKRIMTASSVSRYLRLADEKVKTASTPMETQKPLLKDKGGKEVDVYIYQVNPKVSHLHAVKRIFRKPKRNNTQVPQPSGSTNNVADEAVHKELGDSLVRAATTASSLVAEHDSGGPRCQGAMDDTTAQTRFESVSKHSNDLLLTRGNTLRCDEDRLKLSELMDLCTNLQTKVLDLEKTKITQTTIESLDKESLGEDASKQERRIDAIDQDEDITLTSKPKVKGIVIQEQEEPATTVTTEELTLAQALEVFKTLKPKVKGIVIQEQEEPEPMKPKKKDQIRLDEEAAKRLQTEFNEEERLERERERAQKEQEANIGLIET
nr:retrovirus-related Pol polyprotein from transposon TNT 1-94 [Tanacetum cinerariifolium]